MEFRGRRGWVGFSGVLLGGSATNMCRVRGWACKALAAWPPIYALVRRPRAELEPVGWGLVGAAWTVKDCSALCFHPEQERARFTIGNLQWGIHPSSSKVSGLLVCSISIKHQRCGSIFPRVSLAWLLPQLAQETSHPSPNPQPQGLGDFSGWALAPPPTRCSGPSGCVTEPIQMLISLFRERVADQPWSQSWSSSRHLILPSITPSRLVLSLRHQQPAVVDIIGTNPSPHPPSSQSRYAKKSQDNRRGSNRLMCPERPSLSPLRSPAS